MRPAMAHPQSHPDRLTVASVGVLAATVAAVAHEIAGHGSGCLAVGGRVTLLTSIYFKCSGATGLTDAAGPIGSLVFGLIAAAALKASKPSSWARLFLVISALINLGWFAGQMVYSATLNKGDWAFLTWSLHWPPLWRPVVAAAGVGAYVWATRALAPFRAVGGLGLALICATASAGLAGLLWPKAPLQSAIEGMAAVGIAPAVLLLLIKRRRIEADVAAPPSCRSWPWVAFAVGGYVLFLIGPSRGLGSLS